MEPDVIRIFSSSPPPMDDGPDEDEEEFGDFGAFSVGGVANSVSLSEFDTPTTFNQTQALNATSPPAISQSKGLISAEDSGNKANGHMGRTDHAAEAGSNAGSNTQALTNGFQGTSAPFSHEEDEDFADFAAFSNKAHADSETLDERSDEGLTAVNHQTADSNRTDAGFAHFAAFSTDDTQSDTTHRDVHDTQTPNRTEPGPEPGLTEDFPRHCTLQNHLTDPHALPKDDHCGMLNGNDPTSDQGEDPDCPRPATANGTADRDGSETETETSLGRPLSTEALEELGDMSTTGSVPSPPFQEETATPTGDEEFGDFGDCATDFGNFEQNQPQDAQEAVEDDEDDFGDFNSPKVKSVDQTEASHTQSFADDAPEPHHRKENQENREEDFGDFGDFNSSQPQQEDEEEQVELPSSESFGNFNTAAEEEEVEEESGWSAFGGEEASLGGEAEGESWAAFSSQEVTEEPPTSLPNAACRSERLEKLFISSFPQISSASVDHQTSTLQHLLEPDPPHSSVCVRVWAQLLDIHEALGLRFQWGGSFCNKALLCSLGIDTRNILFTGQKKQPVIVPMYAAGLGMLEPVKPVSAAEMIASIAHNSSCSSESVQEALPPVQFDWSSSGLTNPLDASGGSSLLNLDFFGPVEDSESGAASIPGVDPELFELTTAKLDSNRVNDAFAKLMSTVHTTSTSATRRPQREENLSDEALRVISKFPDLSFMTAKVLMFPATLTPRGAEPEDKAAD